MASGRPKRAHRPIPPVRTGSKCRKVKGYDMTYGHTLVQDIGGGGGTKLHSQRGDVPRADEKTDYLPGLQNGAYRGASGGT